MSNKYRITVLVQEVLENGKLAPAKALVHPGEFDFPGPQSALTVAASTCDTLHSYAALVEDESNDLRAMLRAAERAVCFTQFARHYRES
jgi:hypothetical protein